MSTLLLWAAGAREATALARTMPMWAHLSWTPQLVAALRVRASHRASKTSWVRVMLGVGRVALEL
jgi:hypothetical protein